MKGVQAEEIRKQAVQSLLLNYNDCVVDEYLTCDGSTTRKS